MTPTTNLRPAIAVCCRCPKLYYDSIEVVDVFDGHTVDEQPYWVCGLLKNGGELFFDYSALKVKDGGGEIVQLETDAIPETCPYYLEQFYSQDTAGKERWGNVLPLLKKRI